MKECFYPISQNTTRNTLHLSNFILYNTSTKKWAVIEDSTLEYEHILNYPVTLATLIRLENKFTFREKQFLAEMYNSQFPSTLAKERFLNSPSRESSDRFPFTSFDLENRQEFKLSAIGVLESHAIVKSSYNGIPGFQYIFSSVPYTTTRTTDSIQWKSYRSLKLSSSDIRILDAIKSSFECE